MYTHKITLLLITILGPLTVLSTVFLERDAQTAINISQPCIGYLVLEDRINESKKFKQQLDYLISHPMVHGIILYINSGGGVATAGHEIFEAVKRANLQKPIVSYIEELCASAAYHAATGTSKIVAGPMSSVGSIGTVLTIEKLHPTEFKRNGLKGTVTIHRFKRGKFKQLGSSWDPMTDEDKEQLEQEIDFYYDQFCSHVAAQRNIPIEQIKAQNSLVFAGIQAIELGLIDKVGNLDDALDLLQQELATRGTALPAGLNLKESLIVVE